MLSVEQATVLYRIVSDIRRGKKQVTLGGLAGVGKTSLVKYLMEFFPKFKVCSFTGKAVNVLRKKGVEEASTIHSLIYEPVKDHDGDTYFMLRHEIEGKGLIVDEASMVSRDIYEDLASFKLPMIFIGDHGQLPPVGTDFNLMGNPDYRLETIHRNAGDIARFAEWLRKGGNPFSFQGTTGEVEIVLPRNGTIAGMASADQVICAFNATRVELNNSIRAYLGYRGILNKGEKVICLQNNKKMKLFNGMQGTVVNLWRDDGKNYMDFETDQGLYENIPYDDKQFGKEQSNIEWHEYSANPFEYAYAISCHKAQGDEFDNVYVIEQKSRRWDHKRWAYTAASRAKIKLEWQIADY